nr:NADH dehydrogenase subunit 2 [Symphurus ommaspilus]
MSPLIYTTLLSSLGLGTTLTFMSSHWLLAWMGLEINTLAMVPLMIRQGHPRATEASTKYFLTQATAASVILFAALCNAWVSAQWSIDQLIHPLTSTLMLLALSLKIGLAPFHAWLPEVLQGVDLTTGLILSTWQKLAPFCILLQLQPPHPELLIFIGTISIMIGGWAGLNQTQLRKILAYSSIAHLGWMMIIIQFSSRLSLLALLIYITMTLSVFLTLSMTSTTTISKLTSAWTKSTTIACLIPLVLLSLGGLPPLTGFIPKWLIINELTKQSLVMVAVISALSALLSLFFYLRLTYAMTLTTSPDNTPSFAAWQAPKPHSTALLPPATIASMALIPIAPTVSALIFI